MRLLSLPVWEEWIEICRPLRFQERSCVSFVQSIFNYEMGSMNHILSRGKQRINIFSGKIHGRFFC